MRTPTIAPAIRANFRLWKHYYRLTKSRDPKVRALAQAALAHVNAITDLQVGYLCPEAK